MTRRPRVWILTNLFPRPDEPGRATFNAQQFAHLAKRVDVLCLVPVEFRAFRAEWSELSEHNGVAVRYVPFYYTPGVLRATHGWSLYWSLVWWLRQHPLPAPDHVLGSFAYPDGDAAARIAARLGVSWSLKVHGNDVNVMASGRDQRGRALRSLFKRAPDIVSVSGALRETLLEYGVAPERVRVVYNGIDKERFRPTDRIAARHKLGLRQSRKHVLFVGNLKPSKGCLYLLNALATSLKEGSPIDLHYLGSGPAESEIAGRASASNWPVYLHGRIDHKDLATWYNAATLVALPSDAEGVPNVLLEAMACGTPVVATRVGGIPEVVPADAGMLVDKGDMAALAATLLTALDENWDHARIAAHMQKYDWQDSADALLPPTDRSTTNRIGRDTNP